MPKQKKAETSLTLQQFLESYDYKTLHAASVGLQDSVAWDLMKAFLRHKQREFEVIALDLIRSDSMNQAAAHASGYAQALGDVTDNYIEKLQDIVLGKNGVVESPIPEDIRS